MVSERISRLLEDCKELTLEEKRELWNKVAVAIHYDMKQERRERAESRFRTLYGRVKTKPFMGSRKQRDLAERAYVIYRMRQEGYSLLEMAEVGEWPYPQMKYARYKMDIMLEKPQSYRNEYNFILSE